MKKDYYFFVLVISILALSVSCSNDDMEEESPNLSKAYDQSDKSSRALTDSITPLDPNDFPEIDNKVVSKTNSSIF